MRLKLSNECRTSLYRVIFGNPNSTDESVVFLMAGSREAADQRARKTPFALFDIAETDVYLYNLASFADLVGSGVSYDEDIRIFETAGRGRKLARGRACIVPYGRRVAPRDMGAAVR